MRTKIISIVTFGLVVSSLNCHKSSSSCYYYNLPPSLILLLKKNGQAVPDTILNKTKLGYWGDSGKTYISDFTIASNGFSNMGFVGTRTIGIHSADHNIKTYYLEYTNGWSSDTLYVDYAPPSPLTNCLYVLQTLKFNGQLTPIDTSFHFDSKVYILNKP